MHFDNKLIEKSIVSKNFLVFALTLFYIAARGNGAREVVYFSAILDKVPILVLKHDVHLHAQWVLDSKLKLIHLLAQLFNHLHFVIGAFWRFFVVLRYHLTFAHVKLAFLGGVVDVVGVCSGFQISMGRHYRICMVTVFFLSEIIDGLFSLNQIIHITSIAFIGHFGLHVVFITTLQAFLWWAVSAVSKVVILTLPAQ